MKRHDEENVVDVPVLVVGCGPVGLAMALDLGWRGVRCMIIDKSDVVSADLSRAAMVSARTMEHLRRWGLARGVREAGFPQDYHVDIVYGTSMNGHELAREPYGPEAYAHATTASPEKRVWCPQLFLDPVMLRALHNSQHVDVRLFTEMTEFEQRDDAIVARLKEVKTGRTLEVHCAYMVAADGAGSSVRQKIGFEYPGEVFDVNVNIYFHAALLPGAKLGQAERYMFLGPEGCWGLNNAVDGRDHWRVTVIGRNGKPDITAEEAREWVRRAIGDDSIAFEVTAIRPWRRGQSLSTGYRRGRIFLIGDAAHVMSPSGGHGANTGILDAVNLAWKLHATLEGWGGPQLLDSYEAEQKPVFLRNAGISARNYSLWKLDPEQCQELMEDSEQGERTRKLVGDRLRWALRPEWSSIGVQLGYHYEDSPICIGDGTPPPPELITDVVQSARPGSRAPHVWLRAGGSLLDKFGRGFTLLRIGGADVDVEPLIAAARKRDLPVTLLDLDESDARALYERRLVIVRPDGHVAWRADVAPADSDQVWRRLTGHAPAGSSRRRRVHENSWDASKKETT